MDNVRPSSAWLIKESGDKGVLVMMPRWLLIGLWGILILTLVDGAYLFAFSSYSANERIQAHNEAAQDQQEPDGPIFSVVINSLRTIESFIDDHEKTLIVLATIAIAWFTATLWRATTGLFEAARQQATDTQKSLAIAKQAADASTKSAIALAAAERPYIFVQVHKAGDVNIAVPQERGIFPLGSSYTLLTRNAGKTPAILVKVQLTADILAEPPTNLTNMHETAIPEGGMVIAASQFQEFTEVFWVTEEQYQHIQSGERFLYGYGLIIYADILNPGQTLETGFCWRYEPVNNTWYLIPSKLNRRT